MTTQESKPLDAEQDSAGRVRTGPNWGRVVSLFAWLGFIGLFLVVGRTAVDPRVANPNVEGRPRPVEFLTGFDHWQVIPQVGALIMVVVLTIVFIRGWRKNPGSPVLLMVLVTTLIVWQDPIMNWSPYAVYNPALLHWPESWPLIMMSPTVEPFIVFGYVTFYFGPYFPAIWILRKWQAKYGPESFVSRHPLISLGGLVLVIGFIFDAILEISLVRTGLYIYSQAIPFGTLFPGSTFQFPLIWESLSVTFVMIPAAILVYRDDTGKSVAEKLAAKAKLFPKKPVLGTFLVMFAIINVSYFAYGGWFWAIKASGLATSVACPWPYPEAKVYDPQGYYEENGAEGPYSVGKWSTWQQGLPDGRPDVELGSKSDRCASEAPEWLRHEASSSPGPQGVSGWRRPRCCTSAGWQVVAAMRSVDAGMDRLRAATGAADGDPRLIGVALDLTDSASVDAAAKSIEEAVGAPYALVHNAGISAAGMAEETPMSLWERMFATTVFGPVALTNALLPLMRDAGRGRIVVVSSAGGVRGMPATAPYSAAKGASERWAESLAGEIAPFGLGVTVLVTGTYDTDIITDAGTTDTRDFGGPYGRHHATMDTRGRLAMKLRRKVARPVRRGPCQGSRKHQALRQAPGGSRCADAPDHEPGSADRGCAPGDPRDDGHSAIRRLDVPRK